MNSLHSASKAICLPGRRWSGRFVGREPRRHDSRVTQGALIGARAFGSLGLYAWRAPGSRPGRWVRWA